MIEKNYKYTVQNVSVRQPKCMEEMPVNISFERPVPSDPDVRHEAEELEEKMIKQEQELDKLILITLTFVFKIFLRQCMNNSIISRHLYIEICYTSFLCLTF